MNTRSRNKRSTAGRRWFAMTGLALAIATVQVQAAEAAGAQAVAGQAEAAQAERRSFDIAAQALDTAIIEFSRQGDVVVTAPSHLLAGRTAPALQGSYPVQEALRRLLDGSGLRYRRTGQGGYVIEGPFEEASSGNADVATLGTVAVTGTRIRGATTPSPLITIGEDQIREEGYNNLGDVIRSIPQNFAGGQNPGVALGASLGGAANQNLTSGSALNLRGLGADATLTLLNGRRLSYSGFTNAIDISLIPVAALNRVEVVTDGASAIYGSDAVAGVANIITRRDFEGVRLDYHVGTATQGGGDERRYGLTAGTTWDTGGVIAAYEYADSDAIFAHQRSHLRYMPGRSSLMPELRQRNLFASAYQNFGAAATFSVDLVYSKRDSGTALTQPPLYIAYESVTDNMVIAPTLTFSLPRDWSLTLGGSYAQDETISVNEYFTLDGVPMQDSKTCYCNTARAFEAGAEGPVFALPAGEVRTAVGIGYRENDFESRSYTSTSLTTGKRSSRYAYGEANLPLIAPEQGRAVHRLDATAAFRHENYGDMGSVTTPKLGIVFQPTPDFTLKGSWGKSYKAPNLMQQYQNVAVHLRPAAVHGAVGYPEDATALAVSGGNRDLKPERAEALTASLLFHPRAVPGLQLELGVFDIDYTDRVVIPASNRSAAFRDPNYAQFVLFDPTEEQQAEAIARSDQPLVNATTGPYDPSKVMGILYGAYTNVAQQRIRGVDLSGTYGFALAGGRMTLRGSGSWLDSRQRNSPAEDEFDIAGRVFNPPKFRGRLGAVWNDGRFTLSSFVNHLAGVTDNLHAVATKTGSFTTVDANARYTFTGENALGGLQLGLSVNNLLDRAPPLMEPLFDFIVNYDSTNYSAVGRFVRLSISKQW